MCPSQPTSFIIFLFFDSFVIFCSQPRIYIHSFPRPLCSQNTRIPTRMAADKDEEFIDVLSEEGELIGSYSSQTRSVTFLMLAVSPHGTESTLRVCIIEQCISGSSSSRSRSFCLVFILPVHSMGTWSSKSGIRRRSHIPIAGI